MKNPYDGLEAEDLENLAEWNGSPLLGRKNIGTDADHSGPPKPTSGIVISHVIAQGTTIQHPLEVRDSCSYCEAMK